MKCKVKEFEGYKVKSLNIKDLHQSVNVDVDSYFYKKLKDNIIADGMTNPIIVVEADKDKYLEKLNLHSDLIPNDTEKKYIVYGGSNRLYIAKELMETKIDCVILNDFDAAWQLQFKQREIWV